ncbi:beta-ketoacyl-ACP synthase [Neisseria sp. ZJ106]|uniref:Beta-ketoacyl-ACP synthase n=1 Tax=Neisseria lisongii TaxID=2912188 RepID=A0ABY7RL10_9NEIS|nr:beta-ketoacyl-ACP synthase [Neisseria lisongii]MCF7521114.1 beta-ketoacyl-ACP synthase [Neisseria lisongii]WCL72039.1 beta-ketoacyl-ACP synthase [Neisseria lisongii]
MPIYLQQPAMISAAGCGMEAHIRALLNPPAQTLLQTNDTWVQGKNFAFGAVRETLRPFAEHTAAAHRSRNNQLLWHALEQIEPQIMQAKQVYGAERIAVIIGTSVSGADENIPLFRQLAYGETPTVAFNQQAQLHSDPADFIRQVYGLSGLAYGVSTACTSGARALISAARLLNAGVCDAVICGGVDTLSPLTINGFHALEVLSDGLANPFSANRNGINIGEAAAVFVATRDKQPDSLPLLGYGASSDAYHMSSPHPDGVGAIAAFKQSLQHAALNPDQIAWINAHGTGTRHNDRMESRAVAEVFGMQTAVTSTKPLTGHTLGAAGALEAAFLWAVVSRKWNEGGILPPQLWDGVRDEELPEIMLSDTGSCWPAGRRIGASSSFAFGGNNAVLIIGEEADA